MNEKTQFIERDTETFIDSRLKELGWNDNIHSDRNVYKQQPATEEQKKKLKGKRADYILYQSGTTNPLIVIEAKRPSEDIYQALEQGINYAKSIQVPLVVATNGEFTKAYHINFQKTLTRNGEEVKDFFTEKEALRFIEQPHLITQENKVVLSRRELIKVFGEANDLLRDDGLRKGEERFSEFANILFLKIISEIEENKEQSAVEKEHLWNAWNQEKGNNLKSRINGALEHFRKKYKEGEELFTNCKIGSVKVLEAIVSKLNPLSLVETDSDIKGEAFESFLQQYNAGSKDLGEYFTPRHVIRNLVAILQPLPGDKIYDPFCGTGGMLIECFKYVSQRVNEQKKEELKKCFFGNEKTTIARITKMNMILFGDGHNNIQQRNTFQFPIDDEYDLVITNIPFGLKEKDYGNLYKIGCDYGDCLAVQHCLRSCKNNGTVAMILPEGFFSQKLERYRATRKWIIENFSIQAIISLPQHIFEPYTGSKSSIIIIKKEKRAKDFFWYYQIKKDEFTLNKRRERIEGANDWDELVSAWKKVVIEEKETSLSFQKIYYQKVEKNGYELVREPTILTLPKNREKDYLLLSEIAQIFLGLPFSLDFKIKKEEYLSNGEWKVYQQEHVINNDFSLNNRYISEEKYKELKSQYTLRPNDILISFMGTLGKVAIFPKNAEKGIIYSSVAVVRIKEEWKEKILPEYLLAICQTPQMEKVLLSQSLGTTVQHLRLDTLKGFFAPIPPLKEQQKSIEELSSIKKMIKNSEENTKTLKSSLSLSLSLSLSYEKEIKIRKLEEVATFEYGYTISATDRGEFRLIRITDIDEYGNIWDKDKKYVDLANEADKEKYLLKEGDVIMARIGSVGETAIFQIKEKAIFASYLIRINLDKRVILPKYYWYFVKTSEYWKQVEQLTKGTVQPQFNANSLKEIQIPIPNLEKQKEIIKERERDLAIINYQKQTLQLLKEKQQSFLNNLW